MNGQPEKVIVKSDEEWVKDKKAVCIVIVVYWILTWLSGEIVLVMLMLIAFIPALLLELGQLYREGRILILDKKGLTVKFLNYEKFFAWDEVKIRQLRTKFGGSCGTIGDYDEGVLLSAYKKEPKQISRCDWYLFRHPLSSFQVNFRGAHSHPLRPTRYCSKESEYCAVDKEIFLKKMEEWGVTLSTVRPYREDVFEAKGGKIHTRKNGYGWKMISLGILCVMIFCLLYPTIVLKNYGLLFIFFPLFFILLLVYVVVACIKSYRVKLDERGCIRKFLFFSKRYPWKKIRVKLVPSKESHCGEGVLIMKRSKRGERREGETYSYASIHPFSSFTLNFEVPGKKYGENDALHEIGKELFLKKMKEWGVEVEGLPKEE